MLTRNSRDKKSLILTFLVSSSLFASTPRDVALQLSYKSNKTDQRQMASELDSLRNDGFADPKLTTLFDPLLHPGWGRR